MVQELIKDLKSNNIDIVLSGDDLKISFEDDQMTDELLAKLKDNKSSIVNYLKDLEMGRTLSIPKAAEADGYPITFTQQRAWILSQIEGYNFAYNMHETIIFEGNLDVAALEATLHDMIERFEILRTVIQEDANGKVKQYIRKASESKFKLEFSDLRQDKVSKERITEIILDEIKIVFDLYNGPLFKCKLFQVEDNKWYFLFVIHHVICDSRSTDVVKKNLLTIYNARVQGLKNPLPPLQIQYKDFAVWNDQFLASEASQSQKQFWLKQFEGELPVLELPTDRIRPAERLVKAGIIRRIIQTDKLERFKHLCASQRSTIFTGLASLLNLVFYKYTHQEDLVIGFPMYGRAFPELEEQIGFFADTKPLRTRFDANEDFKALLKNVKVQAYQAFENKDYPFEAIISDINPTRDSSRTVLFDVFLILQNFEGNNPNELKFHDLTVKGYEEMDNRFGAFDLTLNFAEENEVMYYSFEFNESIYNRSTIERITNHFERLMDLVIDNPDLPLKEIDFQSSEEKSKLLSFSNASKSQHQLGVNETILNLFDKQVQSNPKAIAIVCNGQNLTYQELDEQSNQIANYLLDQGLEKGDIIPICVSRSFDMITGMFGIFKAGGVYLPIDPIYPTERIEYMLEDSAAKLVLTQSNISEIIDLQSSVQLLFLDGQEVKNYSKSKLDHKLSPQDLAYIIYTSGSTGKPKGVAIAHQNLGSFLVNCRTLFSFDKETTMPLLTSNAFDIFLFESCYPLISGSTIYMLRYEDIQDMNVLTNYLKEVNSFHMVPAFMRQLINHIKRTKTEKDYLGINRLFIGGDLVPDSILEDMSLLFPNAQIHILYGPTESTVFVTTHKYSNKKNAISDKGCLIGKPNENTEIYLLNEHDRLCSIGVIGEICISGPIVAQAYLKRPELTAEKFVANPIFPDRKMYKTGDLGKWLEDGTIEFIGRKDDQVKIRGYRIELGEIEYVLEQQPNIDSAIIVVRTYDGTKELIAYIVSNQEQNIKELRTILAKSLPAYMIPSHFIQLDELPLTSNGKVNKKKLPALDSSLLKTDVEYVAPRNEIDEKLVVAWKAILGLDKIGIQDNFFDLGGHSLNATRLVSIIHKEFDVKINLIVLFNNPTIENLSNEVEKMIWVNKKTTVEGKKEKFKI